MILCNILACMDIHSSSPILFTLLVTSSQKQHHIPHRPIDSKVYWHGISRKLIIIIIFFSLDKILFPFYARACVVSRVLRSQHVRARHTTTFECWLQSFKVPTMRISWLSLHERSFVATCDRGCNKKRRIVIHHGSPVPIRTGKIARPSGKVLVHARLLAEAVPFTFGVKRWVVNSR